MSTIKTPLQYYSAPGILKKAGQHIQAIGSNALIIGGKTALSVTGGELKQSLQASGISYVVREFAGYPTRDALTELAALSHDIHADVLIGVGGGKVLDLVKAVGNETKLPVVTIPTIAATCAAWSALSVIYDTEGTLTEFLNLETAPHLVLADTNILFKAPVRYLNAGIADTVAKWYETESNLKQVSDFYLRLQVKTAELALEILLESGVKVSNEVSGGILSPHAFRDAVDAILLLAGQAGSIRDDSFFSGVAHPFYNIITRIPETRDKLHGEKVAFGLLVQFVLEQQRAEVIHERLAYFHALSLPVTLEQLGIVRDIDEKAALLADGILGSLAFYKGTAFAVTKQHIIDAILNADAIGKAYLKQAGISV